MTKPTYKLSVSVDEETGRVMAVYLQVRKGTASETREVVDGRMFADYGEDGALLGVEVLGPCDMASLERIAEREEENVKRFLRMSPPVGMLTTVG